MNIDIDELKRQRADLAFIIADREKNLARNRAEMAALNRKIAEAEKPVERFPIGSRAMIPVTIAAINRDDAPHELTHGATAVSGHELWVRESDLIAAAPVPPPLTAERIEAALRALDADAEKDDDWRLDDTPNCAARIAEKLGAVAEPQPTLAAIDAALKRAGVAFCDLKPTADGDERSDAAMLEAFAKEMGAAPDAEKARTV